MLLHSLLVSFAITIITETSLAAALGVRKRWDFAVILLVNILTNPIVVYVSWIFYILGVTLWLYAALAVLEFGAFFAEGFIYKKLLYYRRLNPYVLSLCLNLFSFLGGKVLHLIFF